MKVALFGNMNNNFFCLMRYLRDLNIDAHLFLFKNELNDFKPENDTWNLEKWKPFIHQTEFYNGGLINYLKTSKRKLRETFKGFDIIIGNGFTPALFYKAGLKLSIMYPYSGGIEFIRHNIPIRGKNFFEKLKNKVNVYVYRYIQHKGLKYHTENIWLFDSFSEDYCKKSKLAFKYIATPCLYPESWQCPKLPENLELYVNKMKEADLVVFSHVAHNYKTVYTAKRNDVLINGFGKFIVKQKKVKKPLLVLLNKGADVEYSKQLIREQNFEDNVMWIPLLKRKEIMLLLQFAHVGGGEFFGYLWGGTGWEFMCASVPFLHNTGMLPEEFKAKLNLPYPPILECNNEEDVCNHLLDFEKDKFKENGQQLQKWFNSNNGTTLAKEYANFINSKKLGK